MLTMSREVEETEEDMEVTVVVAPPTPLVDEDSTNRFSSRSSDSENRGVCQIFGKPGHPALRCWNRFDHSYQHEDIPCALAAMRITDVTDAAGIEWYSDNGATAHVTNSPQQLQQCQPYYGSNTVMVGDSNFLPIPHTGYFSIATTSGKLALTDVLVCPGIAKSLLSVSKATKDYPCSFKFDDNGVRVKDKQTKRLLIKGRNINGLYLLEPGTSACALISSRQRSAPDDVWHRWLGHANSQVLEQLSALKLISISRSTKKICEACQLGKSSRLPFSASSFSASRPLERVHCDLWGPAPIMSGQGFRYYVIFIDQWSRFSWFYPLKNKSGF